MHAARGSTLFGSIHVRDELGRRSNNAERRVMLVVIAIAAIELALLELRFHPLAKLLTALRRLIFGHGRYVYTYKVSYAVLLAGVGSLLLQRIAWGLLALGGFVLVYNWSFGPYPRPWVPLLRRRIDLSHLRKSPVLSDKLLIKLGYIMSAVGLAWSWWLAPASCYVGISVTVVTVLLVRAIAFFDDRRVTG